MVVQRCKLMLVVQEEYKVLVVSVVTEQTERLMEVREVQVQVD